jgi:inner membrane protein
VNRPDRQQTQPVGTWGPLLRRGLITAAAVAAVLLLDVVARAASWPLLVQGLLDEPAHVLTAWLCLTALGAPLVPGRRERWVLAGTVLIDLDHLPLYVDHEGWAVDGGRPPTHSLGLLLLLLLVAVSIPRWGTAAAGLAVGVLFHLLRDLATGPGVPLFWPFGSLVGIPYPAYVAVLVVAAAAAVLHGLGRPARRPNPLSIGGRSA